MAKVKVKAKTKGKKKGNADFKHTAIMAAGGKALADGRMIALRDAIRSGDNEAATEAADTMVKIYKKAIHKIVSDNI